MKKPEVLNRKLAVPSFKTGALIAALTFVTLISEKEQKGSVIGSVIKS